MARKTNKGMCDFAREIFENRNRFFYWYGCFGQYATDDLYNKKKQQYPNYYKDTDFSSQVGKGRVMDCVGLVKFFLWADSPNSDPKYNAVQDKSAKGMYNASITKGNISTFPRTTGLLVYKGDTATSIHHVGVYCAEDNCVYEAKGHKYGIVRTPFKQTEWNYWSQCPYTVADEPVTPAKPVEYYPAFNPQRIDQVFKAIGVEDKYIGNVTKRKPIAVANGFANYAGTAEQNLSLIDKAKQGKLIKP